MRRSSPCCESESWVTWVWHRSGGSGVWPENGYGDEDPIPSRAGSLEKVPAGTVTTALRRDAEPRHAEHS